MDIIDTINNIKSKLVTKQATLLDIQHAQEELNLIFSNEYIEYLSVFGSMIAEGMELTGITKSKHRNVIELTKLNLSINKQVPEDCYVIEDTHYEGIVIWQNKQGYIFESKPDGSFNKIACSLNEYINQHIGI